MDFQYYGQIQVGTPAKNFQGASLPPLPFLFLSLVLFIGGSSNWRAPLVLVLNSHPRYRQLGFMVSTTFPFVSAFDVSRTISAVVVVVVLGPVVMPRRTTDRV